jgi:hypothetical protein
MEEHRAKNSSLAPQQTTRSQHRGTTLAAKYGLTEMEIQMPSQGSQTIDHEFNAYVTANRSPKGTDPLAFWEVSFCRCIDPIFSIKL